jgi:hypothetical protein
MQQYLETNKVCILELAEINGKENRMIGVQIVAGVLAVAVLGIIVYRRKQKAV